MSEDAAYAKATGVPKRFARRGKALPHRHPAKTELRATHDRSGKAARLRQGYGGSAEALRAEAESLAPQSRDYGASRHTQRRHG